MDDIEKIDWDPKYSVDIEEIDTHQKKMFELFNKLIDMKKANSDAKECINLINSLNEHSRLYFSIEEKYLRQKKYPDFASHSKTHRQFTKRFISLRRELSEDIANLTYETIHELREWLIDHILNLDSLFVPFLRINQYIEDRKVKN